MKYEIGVDLDDVLGDFTGSLLKYHNHTYGTNAKREDVKTYDAAGALGISQKLNRERIDEFYQTTALEDMPLIDGAKEALTQLKAEGDELYIITARPRPLEERTKCYFDSKLPGIFKDVYSSSNHISSVNNINKGEVCVKKGLQAFVEDGLHYSIQCAERGVIAILLNRPWNQCGGERESKNRFIRVFFWRDIPNTIKRYSSF